MRIVTIFYLQHLNTLQTYASRRKRNHLRKLKKITTSGLLGAKQKASVAAIETTYSTVF